MTDEATPTLPPLPGIDLEDYRRTLIDRFCNPHIGDTLARNCIDGSDRIPKFVLPVIRDQLRLGGEITVAVTAVAAWARYLEGVDEQGQPYDVVDRRSAELAPLVARQREQPELTAVGSCGVRRPRAPSRGSSRRTSKRSQRCAQNGARAVVRASEPPCLGRLSKPTTEVWLVVKDDGRRDRSP